MTAAVLSDPGCHRELNEDCARFVRPGSPAERTTQGVIAVVADGMGGHNAGEIASRTAVDVVCRTFLDTSGPAHKALEQALRKANRAVYDLSRKRTEFSGMGTTCTALALRGGVAISGQVGDSRLYLVRNGEIYLMTEDQTAVAEMLKAGAISVEEARRHPDRNVVLRALGTHPDLEVQMWREPMPVRIGDAFVICSDGLHDAVADEEIRDGVASGDPREACEALLRLARERGGYDNITVAVVNVTPEPPASGSVRPTRDLAIEVTK